MPYFSNGAVLLLYQPITGLSTHGWIRRRMGAKQRDRIGSWRQFASWDAFVYNLTVFRDSAPGTGRRGVTLLTPGAGKEPMMSHIAIVTDSCASIPESLIDSLQIRWVPYYVHRGEQVLRDLVSVQRGPFYQWLSTATELPRTASPGPGDYITMYQGLADEGVEEILSIHMTSKGSGAYQAACVAQSMLRGRLPNLRIEVIDSLNVSMCQGWMVIQAARDALAGLSLTEIVARVKALIPSSAMVQTADTLRYLYMGGRIGRAKHLVGSLLNIKPLIGMEDGVIVALGQSRSQSHTYRSIVDRVESAANRLGKLRIAYVHAAACRDVEKLQQMIEARIDCAESLVAELSPALGVHSGPGTTGVCYAPTLDSE